MIGTGDFTSLWILSLSLVLFHLPAGITWDDYRHKCSPANPVKCHNAQCCSRVQYCGERSGECEDCFPINVKEGDKLTWCKQIEGLADSASHYRDPTCSGACIFNFKDNITIQWTPDPPRSFEWKSVAMAFVGLFVVFFVVLLVCLCLQGKCIRMAMRLYRRLCTKALGISTVNDPHNADTPLHNIEVANDGARSSADAHRENANDIDNHGDETERLIGRPQNGPPIGPSNGTPSGPSNGMPSEPSNGMPSGPSNGMPSEALSGLSNGPSNEAPSAAPRGAASGPPNGPPSHPQGTHSSPHVGAQQTDGATRSKGAILNPVNAPHDCEGATAPAYG